MPRPKIESHRTAGIILQSAKKHFLQKGFEGTSISDVANDARVNKSLIYHHFGNKENLWKSVKEKIIENAAGKTLETVSFKRATLKEFLKDFVTFRFELYAHHPELVHLMHWQRLEPHSPSLEGVINKNFPGLEDHILHLQNTGQIRTDLIPEVISYFIMSTASNGFLDKAQFLKSKKGQTEYLNFIIESLNILLRPQSS